MNTRTLAAVGAAFAVVSTTHAFDDFNLQMTKIQHENVSLAHDVYTVGASEALFDSTCPWFQKPGVGVRFEFFHQERSYPYYFQQDIDLYRPMLDLHFQTYAGVDVGLTYGHALLNDEYKDYFFPRRFEGDMDSVGGYVAKQCDC